MKKHVLIATYIGMDCNYGAVFQATALAKTIKQIGHEASFITFKNPRYVHTSKTSLLIFIKNMIVSALGIFTWPDRRLRKIKFEEFRKKNQHIITYNCYNDFLLNPPPADVYISGSDQVWNPLGLCLDFFFPHISSDRVLISYAASMGCEQIPDKNRLFFEKSIARYDAVSVREDTMVDIISPLTTKTVHHHIDPVFLVERHQWESMARKYENLKYDRYILLYLLNWDDANIPYLLKLKKETGLPLVLIALGRLKPSYADQVIMDASPEEFLYLIKNAEMVVASSFHGVVMSIVFNKPFIAVSGRHNPSRIQSLLRCLDLQDHDTIEMSLEKASYDYEAVSTKIKEEQQAAIAYLKEVIIMKK